MVLATADAQRVRAPAPQPPVSRQPFNNPDRFTPVPELLKLAQLRKGACEDLKRLRIAHVTITAELNTTTMFALPVPPALAGSPPVINLPVYCRVAGQSTPSPTSKILFEVWLPLGTKYNGRYEQLGNGGFAGMVNYYGLGEGIRRGFAAASTDDGNQVFNDATFANVSHDKIVDFGWRALNETTIAAKKIITAFYGSAPKYSYFFGCSDGGREAMQEAQRFPTDFDGIIAAAPANNWTHQFTALAYNTQAAYGHIAPFPAVVPPALLAVLSADVRSQCAGHDGGLPGDLFLTDPRVCTIDWTLIQCPPGPPSSTCLSAAQVAAVKAINGGAKNTAGQIYPGYELGSEDNPGTWQQWITGPWGIGPFPTFGMQTYYGEEFFANFVYHVPVYNLMTLNMDTAVADADAQASDVNAMNADLSPFRDHGGKLIQYVGWADPAVAPRDSIAFYETVRTTLGGTYADQQSFYRLFMAPGMGHCSGGPGPDAFGNDPNSPAPAGQVDADHDVLMALMRWRESGMAPEKIIATHYVADNPAGGAGGIAFQRPLCPYPQVGRYDGTSLNKASASSFVCNARAAKIPVKALSKSVR